MSHLRVDDDVHALQYTWYGPKLDGFLSLFRLKGRTLTEWALLVPLFVAAWKFGVPVVERFAPESQGPLTFLIVRFAASWFGAAYAAKWAYDRFIDPNRPPKYALRCLIVEAQRVLVARGPVDSWVVGLGVVVWWPLAKLSGGLPLPRLVAWGAAAAVACWVARRVVARVQSPERAWRFRHARLARSARFETIEVAP